MCSFIKPATDYSVVMITHDGGIISRHAGTNLDGAIRKAKDRRIDFPNAKDIRVVSTQDGVIVSL